MNESQNIEFKREWKDEYLKWICGFANAEGGTIFIGVEDDGTPCGISNIKKLLEDIPNKVRNILGIIVDVNLREKSDAEYIEINVLPHSHPINYKGQFYYRTGSTMQELKGEDLSRYILRKQGKHWDDFPIPQISVAELSTDAIQRFKRLAAKSNRVDEDVLNDSTEVLLENLQLFDDNSGQLKRGAALLFHPNPERFATGAYIKIGFFNGDDDDLAFQDEIHGPLMLQIEKALDLIKTKYLVYAISYRDEVSREEMPQFPVSALRESLMNAVAHKDYSVAVPIQISVYSDHIVFWNPGRLPEAWPTERLWQKHPSVPYNPAIANTMFRCGDIESWGRGYNRILKAVKAQKLLPPTLQVISGLMVTYYASAAVQLKTQGLDKRLCEIMAYTLDKGAVTNSDVQELLNVSKPTAGRLLSRLVEEGHLIMINSGKYAHYIPGGYNVI